MMIFLINSFDDAVFVFGQSLTGCPSVRGQLRGLRFCINAWICRSSNIRFIHSASASG